MKAWLRWGMRSLGFILLIVLLVHYRIVETLSTLDARAGWLLALAIALNLPQIGLKVVRWRYLLAAQGIPYGLRPASLAYFGSIFIGLLTPGRLGEFIKSVHVQRDCGVASGRAFSSVLADRLFDLAALLIVGCGALAALAIGDAGAWIGLGGTAVLLAGGMALFLHPRGYGFMTSFATRVKLGKLFRPGGWLSELRAGLTVLPTSALLVPTALTVAAYAAFYIQCWIVAQAAGITVSPVEVAFAVTLGSLVTLLPFSISGVGTRDAAIIAYLATLGVIGTEALLFSVLIFLTFHVGSAAIGAVAWVIKPAPLDRAKPPAEVPQA